MAQLQRTQQQTDSKLSAQRDGAVLMAVGWTLLGMFFLVGIFTFSAIREGTPSWLIFEALIGIPGLVLVGLGMARRNRSS